VGNQFLAKKDRIVLGWVGVVQLAPVAQPEPELDLPPPQEQPGQQIED